MSEPHNPKKRGEVRSEQAYAQGKMQNHSRWADILPRKITPSDVDFFFDNKGHCILCELSSQHDNWRRIAYGQWKAYQALIQRTEHVAVLCKHGVDSKWQIDTYGDVEHWQVMVWDFERRCFAYSRLMGGDAWPKFVKLWFRDEESAAGRQWAVKATRGPWS